MIIKYNFDDADEPYRYDANLEDFIESLSVDKLCNTAADIYESDLIADSDIENIKRDYSELNLPEDLRSQNKTSTIIECAKDIFDIAEDDVIYKLFEDDIRDFFEDEAKEAYLDVISYTKDPYAYSGVKRSDFF